MRNFKHAPRPVCSSSYICWKGVRNLNMHQGLSAHDNAEGMSFLHHIPCKLLPVQKAGWACSTERTLTQHCEQSRAWRGRERLLLALVQQHWACCSVRASLFSFCSCMSDFSCNMTCRQSWLGGKQQPCRPSWRRPQRMLRAEE